MLKNKKTLLKIFAFFTRHIKIPGAKRVVRWIFNPDTHSEGLFKFIAIYEAMKVHVDISFFIDWNLFFFGEYDPGINRIIKQYVTPGAVTMDIGANIGCYSLLMAKTASKVYAIEPIPRLIQNLKENIDLNKLKNIIILPIVISDHSGILDVYYLENHPIGREGTLYRKDILAANAPSRKIQKTQSKTLDEIAMENNLPKLDFIKIDVEGHEYPILLGAKESIRKYKPVIIFEYDERTWGYESVTFETAKTYFQNLDYSLYFIRSNCVEQLYNPIPKSINVLALPKNK